VDEQLEADFRPSVQLHITNKTRNCV